MTSPAAVPPRARGARRGFSFIEVLVALGLFLVIAVGILPVFTRAIRSNQASNEASRVSNHARSRMEVFMQVGFNSPDMTLDAGNEKEIDEYYSYKDDKWVMGDTPPATDQPVWRRTAKVRQYHISALLTAINGDGVLNPDDTLPAGSDPSNVHFKRITMEVESGEEGSVFGPARDIELEVFRSQ